MDDNIKAKMFDLITKELTSQNKITLDVHCDGEEISILKDKDDKIKVFFDYDAGCGKIATELLPLLLELFAKFPETFTAIADSQLR